MRARTFARPANGLSRPTTALLGLAAALMFALPMPIASADYEPSIGCILLDGLTDGYQAQAVSTPAMVFAEGETVTFAFSDPTDPSAGASLSVTTNGSDYTEVATSTPPDPMTYVVPAAGSYGFRAELSSGVGTVTFGCGGGVPAPSSAGDWCASGKDYGAHISALAKAGELGNGGIKPGATNGYSQCVHALETHGVGRGPGNK